MIEAATEPGFRSLGQPTARRAVRQSAAHGGFGRTLLVQGAPGAGKNAFVDDLLALAFCANPVLATRPCNGCRGCRDARARTHADLVIGSPEAWREGRSTGESIVAAARRWLLSAAGAPVVADRRIVLIERADRANEQIQNALLKTLEEPTDRHLFILVADDPSRLLPTIRSRCQALRVGPVPRAELSAYLRDHRRLSPAEADAYARIANGLIGTALAYADHQALRDWRHRTQTELLALVGRGRAERFAAVRDLLDDTTRLGVAPPPALAASDADAETARTPASVQRDAALLVLEIWLSLTRDLLVAGAGRVGLAPSAALESELMDVATRVGTGPLIRMASHLERVHEGLRQNAAPKLALDGAMLIWPMHRTSGDR